MGHVNYTDFRQNLARHMDEVCDSRAPLFVTRQGGRSVVVMSEEEYESVMETFHLLKNPANAAHVLEAIAEAEAGNFVQHDLVEDGDKP